MPSRSSSPLLVLLALGCRGPGARPVDEAPRPVRTVSTHAILGDGSQLGTLHELVIEDPRGPIRMWRVENLDRQYMGYADAAGRFFQRVPFAERERFLGIHTMESGLALLYETKARISIQASEADLRKSQR